MVRSTLLIWGVSRIFEAALDVLDRDRFTCPIPITLASRPRASFFRAEARAARRSDTG